MLFVRTATFGHHCGIGHISKYTLTSFEFFCQENIRPDNFVAIIESISWAKCRDFGNGRKYSSAQLSDLVLQPFQRPATPFRILARHSRKTDKN
ncbi:MAG: hypothetical protein WBO29_16490 [Albidovulum sp.]